MIICDRTWKRDGVAVAAQREIVLDDDEHVHLSESEYEKVRRFIFEPPDEPASDEPPGKRSVLRLRQA